MTTQILDLPLLSFSMATGNNEDWLDSWAYLDASSNPISLAGITLNFEVRQSAISSLVFVAASTSANINGFPTNGSIIVGGINGNVVALQVYLPVMSRVPVGSYTFEMIATGDGWTRRIATGDVTIVQGVVR